MNEDSATPNPRPWHGNTPQRASQPELGVRLLIEQQMVRHFEEFEIALLRDCQRITEQIAIENARNLNDRLEGRIQMLELQNARQAAALARLSAAPAPVLGNEPREDAAISAAVTSEYEAEGGDTLRAVEYPSLNCPRCTSNHVRRANRANLIEQFLRIVALAPYRCRACRYKFYRFAFVHSPEDHSAAVNSAALPADQLADKL